MDKLWISYPQGQESVDKLWIKYLFWWITYGSFALSTGNVDNLSTGNVDKFESYPPVQTNVDNLSTSNVDNFENTKQAEEMRGLLHKCM